MKIFFAKKNKQKGFTLIESMVAITIFSMSILALLSVLSRGVASTTYAKNKIVASYLSQEGVEYVRNIRDTTVISNPTDAPTGWGVFKTNVATSCSGNCYLNDAHALTACSGACPTLLYNKTTGVYNYTSGTSSGYIRTITIQSLSNNEVKVNSTVSWVQGGNTNTVTFSDNLYNWIE